MKNKVNNSPLKMQRFLLSTGEENTRGEAKKKMRSQTNNCPSEMQSHPLLWRGQGETFKGEVKKIPLYIFLILLFSSCSIYQARHNYKKDADGFVLVKEVEKLFPIFCNDNFSHVINSELMLKKCTFGSSQVDFTKNSVVWGGADIDGSYSALRGKILVNNSEKKIQIKILVKYNGGYKHSYVSAAFTIPKVPDDYTVTTKAENTKF